MNELRRRQELTVTTMFSNKVRYLDNIYKELGITNCPHASVVCRIENMYVRLNKPLLNFPQYEKYTLVKNIRDTLIKINTDMVESYDVMSLAKQKIKDVSAGITKMRVLFSIAHECKYLSTEHFIMLVNELNDITEDFRLYVKAMSRHNIKAKIEEDGQLRTLPQIDHH